MIDIFRVRKIFSKFVRYNIKHIPDASQYTSVQKKFRISVAKIGALPVMFESSTSEGGPLQNLDPTSSNFGKTAWIMDYDPLGD